MVAAVITYSMVSARPVKKPPHGPMAARAKEYAPPVCGMADAISLMELSISTYMRYTTMAATSMPLHPAWAMPPFQPEKSPEITAEMPMAHRPNAPAVRLSCRFAK